VRQEIPSRTRKLALRTRGRETRSRTIAALHRGLAPAALTPRGDRSPSCLRVTRCCARAKKSSVRTSDFIARLARRRNLHACSSGTTTHA
jgi:hypothetical protein